MLSFVEENHLLRGVYAKITPKLSDIGGDNHRYPPNFQVDTGGYPPHLQGDIWVIHPVFQNTVQCLGYPPHFQENGDNFGLMSIINRDQV